MNDEGKAIVRNLIQAQEALTENESLLRRKAEKVTEAQKAKEEESLSIQHKSNRILARLDHEIAGIHKESDRKVGHVLSENNRIRSRMNELNLQLEKLYALDDKMNRSDARHEKTMQTASTVSYLVESGPLRILVLPKGVQENLVYSGFLFVVTAGIAFPVSLLLSGLIPFVREGILRLPVLVLLWAAEMYGYYRLRRHLKGHEAYYRNKTRQHEEEIVGLNTQKEGILASIQLSHADTILKVDQLRAELQENERKIQELNRERRKRVRTIETKKQEMAGWLNISEQEFLTRAEETILSDYKKEIGRIEAGIRENERFLEQDCRVGPEYQDHAVLEKLISYFRNERASTIKEALELYLLEKREEEERQAEIEFRNKQLQIQQRHLEKLNRQLEILAEREKKK